MRSITHCVSINFFYSDILSVFSKEVCNPWEKAKQHIKIHSVAGMSPISLDVATFDECSSFAKIIEYINYSTSSF